MPSLVGRFGEGGPALPLAPGEEPPRLAARGLVGGGFEMTLAAFFASFKEIGPKHIVLTDGRGGAFVGSREAILFCPPVAAEVRVPPGPEMPSAPRSQPTWRWAGRTRIALRAATLNAASVVAHVDTQTGLLSQDVIDTRLAECRDHRRAAVAAVMMTFPWKAGEVDVAA